MRSSPLRAALTAVLVAAALSACSSSAPAPAGSTGAGAQGAQSPGTQSSGTVLPSGAAQIVISNFAFQPTVLTVSPGQKVTVVNHDSTTHTVTSTTAGAFDTGRVDAGAGRTFTAPTKPGSYPYICTIHPFMHGMLTVS
ncbi:cupredoxin domain-containing protein [Streptacidiphilus sp. EB129]|uniref:cupredoxin domain-containing protein n=1 Tax=Streptacidiphilus sp. EB129 TaxID=3156262 RepID=UPI003517F0F3